MVYSAAAFQHRVLTAPQLATLTQLEGALTKAGGEDGSLSSISGDRSTAHPAAAVVPLVNKLYKLRLEAMLKVSLAAGSLGAGAASLPPPHPLLPPFLSSAPLRIPRPLLASAAVVPPCSTWLNRATWCAPGGEACCLVKTQPRHGG